MSGSTSGWCAEEYHRACSGTQDTLPEACPCVCHGDPPDDEAIHGFFGLTYANYLVLHRTLLQSMPADWQHEFVVLLEQARAAFAHVPGYDVEFWVRAKDEGGHFARDLIPHYQRGRTRVEPKLAGRAGIT